MGPTGPAGSAGNAVVFDTDNTIDTNPGNMNTDGTMANLVADFRGSTTCMNNDIYWHVATGRVFQYQGSTTTNGATALTFAELTNTDSDVTGGFISGEAINSSTKITVGSDSQIEIDGTNKRILIKDS